MEEYGEAVHGELSSANASAGVTLTFYRAQDAVARTIGSTEILVITDFSFVSVAGGAAALYFGTNAAGNRVFSGTFAANGGLALNLITPHFGKKGVTPFLISPIGQVDLHVKGFIKRA